LVAGAGVVALLALLVWPTAPAEQGTDTGDPVQQGPLAAWPVRGSLADDEAVLAEVTQAWRVAAATEGVPAPGRVVDPLYLGEPDGFEVALLRSLNEQGRVVVAAAAVLRDEQWRLLEAAPVDGEVSWLTLPGPKGPRVLAAPEVAAASSLLLRRDDGVWNRAAIRDDGVSMLIRSLDGQAPLLGVVGSVAGTRGLVEVSALSRTSVLPQRAPVAAQAPRWGRGAMLSPEEYDSALYAAEAIPSFTGNLAVLAATRAPGGRVVLVETESSADGWFRYLLVVPGEDGVPTLGAEPVVEDNLAAAVVPRGEGRVLVLVGSAPSIARVEVRDPTGRTLVDGIGPTSIVVPPPSPDSVEVLGKRTNGSVVASLRIGVAD
jgi:hypothetical protein